MRLNRTIVTLTKDVQVPPISELIQGTIKDLDTFTVPRKSCSRHVIRLCGF